MEAWPMMSSSYLRLIGLVSLSVRFKDLLGLVTRVKKKKKFRGVGGAFDEVEESDGGLAHDVVLVVLVLVVHLCQRV